MTSAERQAALRTYLGDGRSLDELYAELGASQIEDAAFGVDPVERGKEVFDALRAELRRVICPELAAKIAGPDQTGVLGDQLTLAGAIASLTEGSLGPAINVTLIAAIAVRIGVRNLCA